MSRKFTTRREVVGNASDGGKYEVQLRIYVFIYIYVLISYRNSETIANLSDYQKGASSTSEVTRSHSITSLQSNHVRSLTPIPNGKNRIIYYG